MIGRSILQSSVIVGAVVCVTAAAASAQTPRTPWGDPDLQGAYTNSDESLIPMERPDALTGRALGDISAAELARLNEQRNEDRIEADKQRWELRSPLHWFENHDPKNSRAWLVVDPPDGKIPPQTADARARAASRAQARRGRGDADSYEDRSLYDRCITRGLPGSMMPAIYGNSYQILQTPDYVAIRYEMIHETRIIPLDNRPHASSKIRTYMGDARGRWEGDTLVVETTNFRGETGYQNSSAATLKLTERFTRVGPTTVKWAVTVEDPMTWARPWTYAMPLTMDDTQPVLEYSCHEGNLGLRNILSSARAEEKAAEDAGAQSVR